MEVRIDLLLVHRYNLNAVTSNYFCLYLALIKFYSRSVIHRGHSNIHHVSARVFVHLVSCCRSVRYEIAIYR